STYIKPSTIAGSASASSPSRSNKPSRNCAATSPCCSRSSSGSGAPTGAPARGRTRTTASCAPTPRHPPRASWTIWPTASCPRSRLSLTTALVFLLGSIHPLSEPAPLGHRLGLGAARGDGLLILRFRPYQEVLLPDLPAVRDGPVQDQAGGEQPSPYQEHQREYPGHGLLLLGGPSGRGLLHLILLVVGGGDHKRDQDEERDPDGDAQ